MCRSQVGIMIAAAALVATCVGCQRETPPAKSRLSADNRPAEDGAKKAPVEKSLPAPADETPSGKTAGSAAAPLASKANEKPAAKVPAKRPEAPAAPTIPTVVLSKADMDASLVKQGDSMPDAELPDLPGKPQSLRSLFGAKLTVVVFWKTDDPYGPEELQDLSESVAKPLGSQGVHVVGIAERDSPEAVKAKVEPLGLNFPILLDRDGTLLAKVATAKLPRTYLLDASGKVLWFDIEYSRSTRRDLAGAIETVLGKR